MLTSPWQLIPDAWDSKAGQAAEAATGLGALSRGDEFTCSIWTMGLLNMNEDGTNIHPILEEISKYMYVYLYIGLNIYI